MLEDNQSYFIRRAKEEQAAAQRATCPLAAAAHRDLAERFAALIDPVPHQAKKLSA